ncbi:methyl-accepting chemotaxis protein [Ectopseudomonas mendocina]|uniref:Methyl-accepting chemotaxis protein n=1 Tax=Ectopseudomonas mendocina TaxID=300 RepID=A0ABZ2REP9_ECTME
MLNNLSLRTKILTLCGASLLVLLIIAITFFSILTQHSHSYKTLSANALEASRYIAQAAQSYTLQLSELSAANQAYDSSSPSRERFEAEEKKVQQYLNALARLQLDSAIEDELSELRADHEMLGDQFRNNADAASARIEKIANDGSLHFSNLIDKISETSEQQIAHIDEQVTRTWISGSLFIGAFTLLNFLAFWWWLSSQVISPLSRVTHALVQLSRGNFGERINNQRRDEVGELAEASNRLSDFLADTFANLSKNTSHLDQSSDELNVIASHMTQGMHEQSLRTDQVAAAMEEMTAAAQEVAGHTVRASQAADDAERATQDGEQAMIALVSSIINTRDEISRTTEVILQLEDDSGRISEVLAVIHSIAEQTNLLALNAAIEAARAGESGRGFAVVADEVRNLAQRTAQSTAEINVIISAVQRGAESAVKAIESGKQSSVKGVEQVQHAGKILNGVTDAVQTIRDMNMQIATAAEEQTLVAEDISRNLTDLVSIAANNQENVTRTEQASSNLRDVSRSLALIIQNQHR